MRSVQYNKHQKHKKLREKYWYVVQPTSRAPWWWCQPVFFGFRTLDRLPWNLQWIFLVSRWWFRMTACMLSVPAKPLQLLETSAKSEGAFTSSLFGSVQTNSGAFVHFGWCESCQSNSCAEQTTFYFQMDSGTVWKQSTPTTGFCDSRYVILVWMQKLNYH